MGEQGECDLAERVFAQLEAEALAAAPQSADALGQEPQAYGDDAHADAHSDALSGAAAPGSLPGYAMVLPGFEAGPRLDLGFSNFPSAWGPIVTPAGGAAVRSGRQAGGAGVWVAAAAAPRPLGAAACAAVAGAGRPEADRRNSFGFGAMPTALAEQARRRCLNSHRLEAGTCFAFCFRCFPCCFFAVPVSRVCCVSFGHLQPCQHLQHASTRSSQQ